MSRILNKTKKQAVYYKYCGVKICCPYCMKCV